MFTLTVIRPDGKRTVTQQIDPPDLAQLQELLGGWLEPVPGMTTYEGRPCRAWFDEEGAMRGLPPNNRATVAWAHGMRPTATPRHPARVQTVLGPMLIVSASEEELARL